MSDVAIGWVELTILMSLDVCATLVLTLVDIKVRIPGHAILLADDCADPSRVRSGPTALGWSDSVPSL